MHELLLENVTLAQLISMKEEATAEDRHLDYKLELPGGRDEDKKEFLADVCSLANVGGGDIIFGVEEAKDAVGKNTGTIANLRGLPGLNVDDVTRRLDAIVRDGLDPRIPGVRFRVIEGGTEGPLLLMRVGRSFAAPHLVKFQNVSRFYSRNSAGKFQLDVREIRAAFAESEQGVQRARTFRLDRIARITPVRTGNVPRWILHIVPVRSVWSADIDLAATPGLREDFRPMFATGWSHRPNLDGLVAVTGMPSTQEATTYSLLFREGAIEAVDAGLLSFQGPKKIIPSVSIEEYVLEYARKYVGVLRRAGIDAPLAIALTFVGVRGFQLGLSRDFRAIEDPIGFDRDEILLPEVVVDADGVTPAVLRPMFDVMWQAAGLPRSLNFMEDGTWKPPR